MYDLTSIPVRHQLWEGWPPSATDDSVSSFAFSSHSFPQMADFTWICDWNHSLAFPVSRAVPYSVWLNKLHTFRVLSAQDVDGWSTWKSFLCARFSACFTQKGDVLDWSKAVQHCRSWSLLSDWTSGKSPGFYVCCECTSRCFPQYSYSPTPCLSLCLASVQEVSLLKSMRSQHWWQNPLTQNCPQIHEIVGFICIIH